MRSSISIDRSLVTVKTFDSSLINKGYRVKEISLLWFEMRAKDLHIILMNYGSNPKIKPYSIRTHKQG